MKMLPFVRAASLTLIAAPTWGDRTPGGPLNHV